MDYKLYRITISQVMPATDKKGAIDRFHEETELTYGIGIIATEKEFVEVVPHVDFARIFRFVKLLRTEDMFSADEVAQLAVKYAEILGYSLTPDEIMDGFIKWVERLEDADEEELDNWQN